MAQRFSKPDISGIVDGMVMLNILPFLLNHVKRASENGTRQRTGRQDETPTTIG